MKIEQITPVTISDLWSGLEPQISLSGFLENAAQDLSKAVQMLFDESIVLARTFITVDFGSLPPTNQRFVQSLSDLTGAGSELEDSTSVLSLVGTYGGETNWQDRRKSEDHLGIPLISTAFVDSIPMISRLLKELGLSLDWVVTHDADMIQKTIGHTEGLFFVENAGDATDLKGRKIITAQNFVSKHEVKSVFGAGGAYPDGNIIVQVVFSRDQFPRAIAENFLPLISLFKSKTASLVRAGYIFSD